MEMAPGELPRPDKVPVREAKKSLKRKGIKSEDVKNLSPIEELCKPIPHASTIKVHSLQRFDNRDILYSKPPD
jgi:hypothetical protein